MDITQTIKAIILLDADGRRILSKFYDPKTGTKQFERQIFVKTKAHRIKDDILVVDGTLVIHRFVTDLHLYVVGSKNENPIILDSVLNCLVEVITSLLNNKTVERQSVMDHLSQVILALDEMCDQGLILETDSNLVTQRTTLKDDVVEHTMAHKLQLATEQFKFPWIRS